MKCLYCCAVLTPTNHAPLLFSQQHLSCWEHISPVHHSYSLKHYFPLLFSYGFIIYPSETANVQRLGPLSVWPWPTCLNSAVLFLLPLPPRIPPSSLSSSSEEFCWYSLSQSWHSTSSVSARSCPGALTASFGQCPSLFASLPLRFGNPGIAGNYWWTRMMRSPTLFGLPLPLPPIPPETIGAFSFGLIQACRQTVVETSYCKSETSCFCHLNVAGING